MLLLDDAQVAKEAVSRDDKERDRPAPQIGAERVQRRRADIRCDDMRELVKEADVVCDRRLGALFAASASGTVPSAGRRRQREAHRHNRCAVRERIELLEQTRDDGGARRTERSAFDKEIARQLGVVDERVVDDAELADALFARADVSARASTGPNDANLAK